MKKKFQYIFRIAKIIAASCFFFSVFLVLLYRFLPPPVTLLMLIRTGEQMMDGKDMKLKKDWVSFEEVNQNLPVAIMCGEDQRFLEHFGFDFNAIKKAYEHNSKKKEKRKIKGASTITQQVAKNVFLWPGRSWIRKGLEAYFTVWVELLWPKKRILEVYMNVVEMGDGIYGAEAAAQAHFKKSAKKLSKEESALIASVLPNPRRWSPAKPSPYIYRRQRWILRNMRQIGKMDFNE